MSVVSIGFFSCSEFSTIYFTRYNRTYALMIAGGEVTIEITIRDSDNIPTEVVIIEDCSSYVTGLDAFKNGVRSSFCNQNTLSASKFGDDLMDFHIILI